MSFVRFQEIVRHLADSAIWDRTSIVEAGKLINEMGTIVEDLKKPDLTELVEGAGHLVRLAPKLDSIEAEDCQRMVMRLTQIALRRLHSLRNARKKDLSGKKGGSSSAAPRPGMAIGDVLIQLGFISPEDLERALRMAETDGSMVGQALVTMGLCEREDVARAVFLQKSLQPVSESDEEDLEESSDGKADGGKKKQTANDILLGEAFLRRGWVNPAELVEALELHNAEGIRIGDALIRLGFASIEQVQQALSWQTELRAARAAKQAIPSAYNPEEKKTAPALPKEDEGKAGRARGVSMGDAKLPLRGARCALPRSTTDNGQGIPFDGEGEEVS